MLGTPLKERTPGVEFATHLMDKLAEEGKSLYLLGAKPGVAEQAGAKLAAAHPGLRIAGTHDGYFKEDGPVVAAIRQSGADVVFVVERAPKFWTDHGLEWFYRLCKEPRRIGRMMKLPLFLIHVKQEKRHR